MKRSYEKQIYVVFACAFVVLAAAHVIFYLKIVDLHIALQARAHSNEMLKTLKSMSTALYDAESQKRGFLLTGDESFRETFEKALERMPRVQAELDMLTLQMPKFQLGIREVASGFETRIRLLKSLMKMPRAEVLKTVERDVKKGQLITEAVEALVTKLETELEEQRALSDDVVQADMRYFQRWSAITLFLTFGIFVSAGVFIHRAKMRHERRRNVRPPAKVVKLVPTAKARKRA